MNKNLDRSKLLKIYDREFDQLIENIETIESEVAILKGRLARLELLDQLIQEAN